MILTIHKLLLVLFSTVRIPDIKLTSKYNPYIDVLCWTAAFCNLLTPRVVSTVFVIGRTVTHSIKEKNTWRHTLRSEKSQHTAGNIQWKHHIRFPGAISSLNHKIFSQMVTFGPPCKFSPLYGTAVWTNVIYEKYQLVNTNVLTFYLAIEGVNQQFYIIFRV